MFQCIHARIYTCMNIHMYIYMRVHAHMCMYIHVGWLDRSECGNLIPHCASMCGFGKVAQPLGAPRRRKW